MEYKEKIVCAHCGREFIGYKYRERKYCSKECFLEAKRNRVTKECEYCGEQFDVIASRKDTAQYCSKSCRMKERVRQVDFDPLHGEEHPPNYQGPVEVGCWTCGKKFKVSRGRYNAAQKRDQKRWYCSKECLSKGRSKRYRGENGPNYQDGNIKLTCDFCGKDFEMPYWQYRNGLARNQEKWYCSNECRCPGPVEVTCSWCNKTYEIERRLYNRAEKRGQKDFFCSPSCKAEWQSENLRGEDSYNWHGGSSFEPYGPGFNNELRHRIRKRDHFKCQLCGRSQRENIEASGRKLSVHHIDYSKDNHSPDNLISLCHNCHSETNGNREHFKALFAEMLT